ncbi:MAG: AsmA family protein [Myxococcota bacterium]
MRWTRIAAVLVGLLVVGVVALVIALNSIDWSRYKEPVIARVKEATGRDLAVDGEVRLHIGLRPGVGVEGVRFQNADWGERPDMVEVGRFEVQLALWPLLFRRVEVERIVLSDAVIWLEVDETGRANWTFEPAAPAEAGAEAAPPSDPPPAGSPAEAPTGGEPSDGTAEILALVHELVVERSQFVYADASSGTRQEVEIERLTMRMADVAAPLELEARLAYNGEPIEASAEIGGAGAIAAGGAIDLDVEVLAGGASLAIRGPIERPLEGKAFSLQIEAGGESLAGLSGLAGSDLPGLGPYRLATRASDGPDLYRADALEIDLGESRVRGEVAASLAGPRPRVEARLTSSLLRAADLGDSSGESAPRGSGAPAAQTAEAPAAGASDAAASDEEASGAPERLFPSDPLPLDGLAAVDADISLSIDVLELDTLVLRAVELGVALDDRDLHVNPLRAELAGGALDGRIGLASRRSPPSLDVKADLDRLDSGQLLRALGVTEALSGARVDALVQVAGRGQSVADIMASLGGDLQLEVGPGRIDRKWAEAQLGDWAPLVLGEGGKSGKKNAPTLNCVVARFRAADGLARSRGIAVDTPVLAVLGDGDIDLGDEQIDLALEPVVKEADAGLVTPSAAVEGPLSAPEFGLDEKALVGKAVGIATALASGDSVVGGKDVRTSEGIDGCNELIDRRKELVGDSSSKQSKQAKKALKKKVKKAKKKLKKQGLKELESLLD